MFIAVGRNRCCGRAVSRRRFLHRGQTATEAQNPQPTGSGKNSRCGAVWPEQVIVWSFPALAGKLARLPHVIVPIHSFPTTRVTTCVVVGRVDCVKIDPFRRCDLSSTNLQPAPAPGTDDFAGLFIGSGALATHMRSHDWSNTAVGEPGQWPQSSRTYLKTTARAYSQPRSARAAPGRSPLPSRGGGESIASKKLTVIAQD